jgi:hypothetical protein
MRAEKRSGLEKLSQLCIAASTAVKHVPASSVIVTVETSSLNVKFFREIQA